MLQRIDAGDEAAASELFEVVYGELRAIAGKLFGGRGASHTLQPTALAHEAWLRLVRVPDGFRGREHFLAVAATAMRQILSDHARTKRADKRGGAAQRVTLGEVESGAHGGEFDLVALDDALQALAQMDARIARVAELRLLGGLSSEEAASVLGVTARTVQNDWRAASAWLERALAG